MLELFLIVKTLSTSTSFQTRLTWRTIEGQTPRSRYLDEVTHLDPPIDADEPLPLVGADANGDTDRIVALGVNDEVSLACTGEVIQTSSSIHRKFTALSLELQERSGRPFPSPCEIEEAVKGWLCR